MNLKVLESTRPIVWESRYVFIDKDKVSQFCSKVKLINLPSDYLIAFGIPSSWSLEEYSELILTFNTINFSYWAEKGKFLEMPKGTR